MIFRFEAFWANDEGCKEVVERSWSRRGEGRRVERWLRHQNSCRENLTQWSKNRFRSAYKKIISLSTRLGNLQDQWEVNKKEIRALAANIEKLEEQDELF